MKNPTPWSIAAFLFAAASSSYAAFVTPTAVLASNGEDTAPSLIDGLGLSDNPPQAGSTHDPAGGSWSAVGSIKANVVFDLGSAMDITKAYIWNFNVADNTPTGMKDLEIQVSAGVDPASARFTTVAQVALTEGGDAAQSFDIVASDVRLIRLNGLTNWGNGFTVGLAEVRFESGNIAGSTPFVEISNPLNGDVIPLGSTIDLSATIADADNDLATVEFFDGAALLGTDNSAPYSFSVSNPDPGEHVLKVKATDKTGKVAWSTVNVTVRDVLSGSVIVIDDEADIGEGNNQITYSEGWTLAPGNANDPRFNNNDHYSGTKGNWFEIKFTGAKRMDLYATVASHSTATAQLEWRHGVFPSPIRPLNVANKCWCGVAHCCQTASMCCESLSMAPAWSPPTASTSPCLTHASFKSTTKRTSVQAISKSTYSDGWTLAPGNANDPRFNNNDDYSGTKDNWFELKFTGVRVDVYATVASHHGSAKATIDGGTAVPISYQTAQRGEQVFIWSSPLLPNRQHTLRITVDGTGVVTADRFDVHVPTTRIVQVDDELGIGEGVNQITYSEGWTLAPGNENDPRFNNNDHYSGTKGNWFEIKFVGVQIDLFATVASHHGTATATIDGGTEVAISYQAVQRGEQVLVWESPQLPNREHVLRVLVDGTGVVTADRFDIHVSDEASADLASVNRVDSSLSGVQLAFKDFGDSVVDPATLKLQVDGQAVQAAVHKEGDTTTLSYTPTTPYGPGSEHHYQVGGSDTNGNALLGEGSFIVPTPPFSLTGLGGPKGRSGVWGFRQIWGTGALINSLGGAVETALAANQPGFTGRVHDSNAPTINFTEEPDNGDSGLFAEDNALPGEAEGLTASDFVNVAHAFVRIPSTGDWTIGVHSDEGFGLRFIGAEFASATGNGVVDSNFAEYLIHPTNTRDSNTRGVLQGLEAGVYEIEIITWERSGDAFYEVYAAQGVFIDDGDSEAWALIGSADGLELVGAGLGDMKVVNFAAVAGEMTVDFTSPAPGGIHQLQRSLDLVTWTAIEPAAFSNLGDGILRGQAPMTAEVSAEYVRAVLLETPPIYKEDFESGAVGWIAGGANAADTQWELGVPLLGPSSAFSGENVYGTDLDGTFAAGAFLSLQSPVIDLEGEQGRPRLSFQYYIDATEDAEGGRLNFLAEDGELLFNDSNLIFWGNSADWVEYNRPVPSEVRGRKFILEFQLLSDDQEPNGSGWYIDDVQITK